MAERRLVLFVSDHTGITVESMGLALLSQFPGQDFRYEVLPFVDSVEKATAVARRVAAEIEVGDGQPLLFSSLVDPELRRIVAAAPALCLDFFDRFVPDLEQALGCSARCLPRQAHGIGSGTDYLQRMEAVNFTLAHDDGIATSGYRHADVVLVGVSRCGKTPTCLYLALNCGLKAANYPITDEDLPGLEGGRLPPGLAAVRERLYGLTIDPEDLQRVREARRPGGDYASLARCRREVAAVEAMYARHRIAFSTTSGHSVEELAATIRQHLAR